jgi:hypothetical protein
MTLRDALETLRGKYQRAIVWATETKTGRRVEASWTFKVPEQLLPQPASAPVAPATLAPSSNSTVATAAGSAQSSLRSPKK